MNIWREEKVEEIVELIPYGKIVARRTSAKQRIEIEKSWRQQEEEKRNYEKRTYARYHKEETERLSKYRNVSNFYHECRETEIYEAYKEYRMSEDWD